METLAIRLRKAMEEQNIKQIELTEKTGIPKSAISQYLSGKFVPKQDRLTVLAVALNVNEAWLMGYDAEKNRNAVADPVNSISNIIPMPETRKVPLLGSIACGEPILAVENIEDYIDMNTTIHADFALRCKGDSMINVRIFDGDIVYIRKQSSVENGEIAAVLISGLEPEATLKRIYLSDDSIRLCAANPMYPDKIFEKEKMNDVVIIGKAVAFLSTVR